MADRDRYDFSALGPNFSELEDATLGPPVAPFLRPGGQFSLDGRDDDDFEAELERLTSEEQALSLDDAAVDAQFRTLQRVIAELSETIADPDLDAEEAWLEALLEEEPMPDVDAFRSPE